MKIIQARCSRDGLEYFWLDAVKIEGPMLQVSPLSWLEIASRDFPGSQLRLIEVLEEHHQ